MVLQKVLDGHNEHFKNYPSTVKFTAKIFLKSWYRALPLGASCLANNENLGCSILLLGVLINFYCKHNLNVKFAPYWIIKSSSLNRFEPSLNFFEPDFFWI